MLPPAAPQISGMKSVLPESGVPSSEPGRMQSLERGPTPSGSGEAAVSFDLPAQADPLHCANKVMKPPLLACLPFFFFFFKRKTNQNNLHVSSEFIGYTGSADSDSSFEGGASSFLQPPRLPSTSLVLCPPFHHPRLLCLCSISVASSLAPGCSLETF